MIKVLYEDNHIIAVVKPAGVLTQGDRSGDSCLLDYVKEYLKAKYKKPGNVFLGLAHRLDKPVSGIVLFGKTSKGAARLSEQFRNHTIQKIYHGIVAGKLKEQKGAIKEKVNKIAFFAEGFAKKSDEELLQEIKKATKTRTAELSWEAVNPVRNTARACVPGGTMGRAVSNGVKANDKFSLVKILPKTGRFHQIRIQMANMGHPILGDRKYSKTKMTAWKMDSEIALCATGISFKIATGEKTINLQIPLPEEWSKFLI